MSQIVAGLKMYYSFLMSFCACLVLLSLPGQTSAVQIDWLNTGKEFLGTMGTPQTLPTGLTDSEIARGLKDALRVGTKTVVGQLGQMDGFNADPAVHIPLPDTLQQVKSALGAVGMSGMMDDLELKLNRAAEQATVPARQLFLNSIETMTIEDVKGIYTGPDDAATRYFQKRMSEPLAAAMQPIVDQTLNEVGAIQAYDAAMSQYASLPFMPNLKADLNSYVVDKGLDGIFHYLAIEEAAIRENPAKRTTEILQTVFGAQ
jgi:hypothetical protein